MLRAPDKRLRYSKQHFQGYFLQLHAYLRKDSDTDDYLDGIFTNPITDLVEGHARELKRRNSEESFRLCHIHGTLPGELAQQTPSMHLSVNR